MFFSHLLEKDLFIIVSMMNFQVQDVSQALMCEKKYFNRKHFCINFKYVSKGGEKTIKSMKFFFELHVPEVVE